MILGSVKLFFQIESGSRMSGGDPINKNGPVELPGGSRMSGGDPRS